MLAKNATAKCPLTWKFPLISRTPHTAHLNFFSRVHTIHRFLQTSTWPSPALIHTFPDAHEKPHRSQPTHNLPAGIRIVPPQHYCSRRPATTENLPANARFPQASQRILRRRFK
ncbi:hypothetical protein [Rubritalea tangerina]|uniref:hypothetical protein n=1 Tax=Rubritalea tangerina TaxID=430798 RepID=UPI00361EEE92